MSEATKLEQADLDKMLTLQRELGDIRTQMQVLQVVGNAKQESATIHGQLLRLKYGLADADQLRPDGSIVRAPKPEPPPAPPVPSVDEAAAKANIPACWGRAFNKDLCCIDCNLADSCEEETHNFKAGGLDGTAPPQA